MTQTILTDQHARRHDLDAIRVLAFGLLIFYHIGMFYVANWDYHVKSAYQSQTLESLMLLVNHWRLPLLFMISGLAIRFVLAKMSVADFLGRRHVRLLVPLVFGVLVVVPPQLYFEMLQNGDLDISYWRFYQAFFDLDHTLFADYQAGILPHMDVNHLWYIRELWTFSIYLLVLLPVLNSRLLARGLDWLADHGGVIGLLLLPLPPLLALGLSVDSDSESHRIVQGFMFVLYGYLLGWHAGLWRQIMRYRRVCLLLALLSYAMIVTFYNLVWLNPAVVMPDWAGLPVLLVRTLNTCGWVLAILGYGAVYLNKPGPLLSYLNEAVFPYYILHQTIIIVAGYQLGRLALGPVLEPVLLIIITLLGCGLLHEYLIRRVRWLRPLFGLRWRPPEYSQQRFGQPPQPASGGKAV